MMTRKDYKAIADAIRAAYDVAELETTNAELNAARNSLKLAMIEIAGHCAAGNPRFDRARFYRAAVGEWGGAP